MMRGQIISMPSTLTLSLASPLSAASVASLISAGAMRAHHNRAIIDLVCLGKARILASPHAFAYYSCNEQVLSLAGSPH
jgi:hypothetical protein